MLINKICLNLAVLFVRFYVIALLGGNIRTAYQIENYMGPHIFEMCG
jgi:hypothetical protein